VPFKKSIRAILIKRHPRLTGIFFHYQQGERLRDFPNVLGPILAKDNIFLYDALYDHKPASAFDLNPISIKTLHKVHSRRMIEQIISTNAFEGALYSASGTVSAGERIFSGEIDNAFVFTGYGDHHAGSNFFGGGCYFNGAAITIHELRKKIGIQRFAIIDTDAHHGDGTWEIFQNDPDVLYICFCTSSFYERNHNVNIQVPHHTDDASYLTLVKNAFQNWIRPFQPKLIFWNWGYDGTIGDYGDLGLTPQVHQKLAGEFKKIAHEICRDRLIVILCGGSRRDLATRIIPEIINVLAD